MIHPMIRWRPGKTPNFWVMKRPRVSLRNETDALVVVVSEETGIISLAIQGEIKRGLDATSLNNNLLDLLNIKKSQKKEELEYKKSTA